jgi:hypothetical protein
METATPAAGSSAVMEAMFQPSTRLRNFRPRGYGLPSSRGYHQRPPLMQFELIPDLTPQDVLATGISVEDFHRFLHEDRKVVSMAPGVFISSRGVVGGSFPVLRVWCRHLHFSVCHMSNATRVMATATCDFIVCLFANINIEMIEFIHKGIFIDSHWGQLRLSPPVSGAALAFLFRESRSNVRSLSFLHCILNEEHIRALSTESRPDMKVNLSSCELEDTVGCRNAFVECLRNNKGPTELSIYDIDLRVLASALRDNSRVTSIDLLRGQDVDHTGQGKLFRALADNRDLVEVNLRRFCINDENWAVLREYLQGHPTLTSLSLEYACPLSSTGTTRLNLSKEQKGVRARMVAEMMRENTILPVINFRAVESDEQIYKQAFPPHLVSNRYRPRVIAVTEICNRQIRKKVLGRALYSVRSNPNLVRMFLSENVKVFAPLNTEGIPPYQSTLKPK